MNILLLILFLMVIWRAISGFRKGFADECIRLVTVCMALVTISVILLLIAAIMQKNGMITFVAGALLVVVVIVFRLADMLLKSIKMIAELPVLNILNKLLGLAAGVLEVLVVFWIMYVLVGALPASDVGGRIMEWTKESLILQMIYDKNHIANFIVELAQ